MNLEDHAGDVIRKGRLMTGVSVEQAASAAGVTAAALEAFEEAGRPAGKIDFQGLAGLIGLDGGRLAALAGGWLPAARDLALWRELRQITTYGEGMGVNGYLVWDEISREAALFDTGWDAAPMIQIVRENELVPRHLFLTHGHRDHVAGVAALRAEFPRLRLHSGSRTAPPEQRILANSFIHLGSLRITNRDTPGHAEDGITYMIGNWPEDAPYVAIVGDAVFAGSIGRGNQSWDLAKQKVRDQILTLPPDTLICPGHGPVTTVAEEKAHNPFL